MTEQSRPTWDDLKATQGAENARVIKEFHDSEGRVARYDFDVVLLHHKGVRSGLPRVNPLAYLPVGENFAVFATCAGSPRHPDWYRNLVAHPGTTVEIGTETIEVEARVTSGDEREEIWSRQKREHPHFAEMEAMTTREIPVVLLERRVS